jgi:hypothetical protein
VISRTDDVLLLIAGALAGAAGSAGGITSLISYPALLAVGIPALPANVTQAVSFVMCLPGSALGSRAELRGQWPFIRRWIPLVATGSSAGIALLLSTPDTVFERVVPFLLAAASLLLLTQPWIARWQDRNPDRVNQFLFPCGLFAVAVYGGYFGAGAGVMVLALILLTQERQLARANALKNVLVGVVSVCAAIAYGFFGPVHWAAALPLATGMLFGSMVGPSVTRRVPSGVLRVNVAFVGLGLAVRLWIDPA